MRQSEDIPFQSLLSRARTGILTKADLEFLNNKVVTSLAASEFLGATAVVKLNSLRHQLNRYQRQQFARTRSQQIYIFPALHTRTKSTAPKNLRLHIDDLLAHPDHDSKIPFPGLFLYT